jgi:hypothetical protein
LFTPNSYLTLTHPSSYRLQYYPLVLKRDNPHVEDGNEDCTLQVHVGDPSMINLEQAKTDGMRRSGEFGNDIDIPAESMIRQSLHPSNRPEILITVTGYNEPYTQFVDTMAGLYRNYYELVHWDKERFLNKVQVVIVVDGYDRLGKDLLRSFEDIGLYNSFANSAYKEAKVKPDKSDYDINFKGESVLLSQIYPFYA